MKMVFSYLKPYLKRMSLGLIIKIIGTVMDLAIPYILSYIIDNVIETKNWKLVITYGALMVVCAIIGFVGNVVANRMAAYVAMKVTTDLRHDLFVKIMNLSFRETDEITIPSLISRLSSDTYNVHQMLGMMQRIGIRAPILLIGGIIVTFTLDVKLALILLATLPLIGLITFVITKKGIPLYTEVQLSIDDLIRSIRENASGSRVIKALSKGEYEKEKFSKINQKVYDVEIKSGSVMSRLNPSINLVLNYGLVAVIIIGAFLVNTGEIKTGVIIAFTSYFTIILNAMISITRIFIIYSRSAASAARIDYCFKQKNDLEIQDLSKESFKRKSSHIEFKNVSFSYNKKLNNLENVSFKLNHGESLGIIGATGSGKTTLINLLMRFYDVDSGSIMIDGHDIKEIPAGKLKKMFGAVFQNDTIFNDSVYENINFGRDLDLNLVKKASSIACADSFINALPEKYDTVLSPKGTNVSGGQKQRLLIARSIASKPEILILDDATSALDYKTDSIVRRSINEYLPNTTKIIVTQRVSSIKNCELILVVDDGKIISEGKHEDLMKESSIYKEIYLSQMGGEFNE